MTSKKPWNPLLGETYACRWPNGVSFYAEQISHHPPVSAVQLTGPGGVWSCHGQCFGRIDNGVQAVNLEQKGTFSLSIEDGTEFEWEFPTIEIRGNVTGERTIRIKGSFVVFDRTNDLECWVEVNPKKDKRKGTESAVATTVVGAVKAKRGEAPATITGDYCGKLVLNGDVIWDIEDPIVMRPTAAVDDSELLLSDCRYRLDRNLFIQERLEEADSAKLALEGMQRKEAALRGGLPPAGASPRAPPSPPPDAPPAEGTAKVGKSIMTGFSAFKKFAGKQFSKLGQGQKD
jgi:hypothetical protein